MLEHFITADYYSVFVGPFLSLKSSIVIKPSYTIQLALRPVLKLEKEKTYFIAFQIKNCEIISVRIWIECKLSISSIQLLVINAIVTLFGD